MKVLFTFMLLCASNLLMAQSNQSDNIAPPPENRVIVKEKESQPESSFDVEDNSVYTFVEENPMYQGGWEEMNKWISQNLKFPKDNADVQGKVFVSFVVEKDGSLSDIKIVQGLKPNYDDEAIRLVKMMPKWKPGRQNGKFARVKSTIPVIFKLAD